MYPSMRMVVLPTSNRQFATENHVRRAVSGPDLPEDAWAGETAPSATAGTASAADVSTVRRLRPSLLEPESTTGKLLTSCRKRRTPPSADNYCPVWPRKT